MQETVEIEVFRADTKASRGITAADIAQVAEFDCDAHPVAGVIGHPKSESEADAEIVGFRAEGSTLFATIANWSDNLVDKIRKKKIINRSMAFFAPDHEANPTPGKWAPRHLGFLGASAPGIPGMSKLAKAFAFDAATDDLIVEGEPATAIIYAPAEKDPTPTFTVKEEVKKMDETPEEKAARLEKEENQLKADRTAFAAEQKASRETANKSRVAALVKSGHVLPANQAALELVFNALGHDELEFSADDKGIAADKLAEIIGAGPQLVDADGKQISPNSEKKTEFEASGDNAKDTAQITAAANELCAKDKTLSFEAAVEKVMNGEEA